MAIKEKDLPVSGSYGPGVYVRTVSASGASQKTGFAAMKEALDPTVDSALSTSSTNPVQNKIITGAISDLKEDSTNLVSFATNNNIIEFTEGAYIKTDNTPINITTPTTDAAYKYAVIPCSEGDIFTINAQGAGSARTFAFLDSSNQPIYMAASGYIADGLVLTAPTDAANLVINDRIANNTVSYYGKALKDRVVTTDAVEQVLSSNIYGMIATNNTVVSQNIFSEATLLKSGYYVGVNNGIVSFTANASYDTYLIKVDGSRYNFTNVRFGVKLKSDATNAIGDALVNVTAIDTDGADYVAFSFNPTTYPTTDYEITKNLTVYRIPNNWDLSQEIRKKSKCDKASGTLADGEYIEISGRSALKSGECIVFKGTLTSFTKLRLAFMYAGGVSNYVDVDATNITIKNDTSSATATAHGLTITNDIEIIVEFIKGSAKITLISNGSLYSTTVQWAQISGVASSPRVISTNTVCSYAELRTVYNAVGRNIWYFGDSYISFNSTERWVYYLKEYGYDENILLSGSAGCSSAITRTAIETLLKYGNPKMCVMATGMNDGSDSGDTPATTWVTNREYFIFNCNSVYAEPIFCTIPTTPTVNNEAKNAWVRSSGYRYIDFAKAVGAQSDGTWYSGMLASDNVHPTEKGAKALFSQVLIDLPEVMLT